MKWQIISVCYNDLDFDQQYKLLKGEKGDSIATFLYAPLAGTKAPDTQILKILK